MPDYAKIQEKSIENPGVLEDPVKPTFNVEIGGSNFFSSKNPTLWTLSNQR